MTKHLVEVPAGHTLRITEDDDGATLQILRPDGTTLKEIIILAAPRLEGDDADDDD